MDNQDSEIDEDDDSRRMNKSKKGLATLNSIKKSNKSADNASNSFDFVDNNEFIDFSTNSRRLTKEKKVNDKNSLKAKEDPKLIAK